MTQPAPTQPLITGIHHVTAIAGDPRRHHDFYTRVLGLRLVKKTVNFDDPHTYHLYYGDDAGSPGTLLTHFPHARAKAGRHGSPEITTTALTVPPGSLGFWHDRLRAHHARELSVDGERRLFFEDPDTMRFELIEDQHDDRPTGFAEGGVGAAHAITGIERVSIRVADLAETISFLQDTLGFRVADRSADAAQMHLGDGRAGQRLELRQTPEDAATRMGAGTVHHVAWRVPDEATQARVAQAITAAGVAVTPVMDRQYFRSIYCTIPGGVIFEVATDGPGFDVDEPPSALGTNLCLPPQHERRRDSIQRRLVPLPSPRPA